MSSPLPTVTHTVEGGQTFFSLTEISAVIVPVGSVPREQFDKYAALVSSYRRIDLAQTKSFYAPQNKTPFNHINWADGCLNFKYKQLPDPKDGTGWSPMQQLHAHQQVLGVIGICFCPSTPNIGAAYAQFQAETKRYATVGEQCRRCFAFEPSEQQIAQDDKARKDFMMFPPESTEQLENHLDVLMHDFAACVLMWLEYLVSHHNEKSMQQSTWFDGLAPVPASLPGLVGDEDPGKLRRRLGRLMKMRGDLSLLAGSPFDAQVHYKSAVEQASSASDSVWHAGALQGFITAKLMYEIVSGGVLKGTTAKLRMTPRWQKGGSPAGAPAEPAAGTEGGPGGDAAAIEEPVPESPQSHADAVACSACYGFGGPDMWLLLQKSAPLLAEVESSFLQARTLFQQRSAVACQLQLQLQYCRLLVGLYGTTATPRREAAELVTQTLAALPQLTLVSDKLTLLLDTAQVLGLVGAHRKQAFVLWQALELVVSSGASPAVDLEALQHGIDALVPHDGLPARAAKPKTGAPGESSPVPQAAASLQPPQQWRRPHAAMLTTALHAAIAQGLHWQAWRLGSTLSREYWMVLTREQLREICAMLATAAEKMPQRFRKYHGPGPLPTVRFVRLVHPAPEKVPRRMHFEDPTHSSSKHGSEGPFLYRPPTAAEASEELLEVVAGEAVEVEVYVHNPGSCFVHIELMQLWATFLDDSDNSSPSRHELRAVSVKLPAGSGTKYPMSLKLGGSRHGRLQFMGCTMRAEKVSWNQSWLQNCRPPLLLPASSFAPPSGSCREDSSAAAAAAAAAAPKPAPVQALVLPPLPLLECSVAGSGVYVLLPTEAAGPGSGTAAGSAAAEGPVRVRAAEGAVMQLQLRLRNAGATATSALALSAAAPPGLCLLAAGGLLGWQAFQGALVQALPEDLAAAQCIAAEGGTATLPVSVHVGMTPAGQPQAGPFEVALQLQYSGGAPAPDRCAKARPGGGGPAPPQDDGVRVLGRALTKLLHFELEPGIKVEEVATEVRYVDPGSSGDSATAAAAAIAAAGSAGDDDQGGQPMVASVSMVSLDSCRVSSCGVEADAAAAASATDGAAPPPQETPADLDLDLDLDLELELELAVQVVNPRSDAVTVVIADMQASGLQRDAPAPSFAAAAAQLQRQLQLRGLAVPPLSAARASGGCAAALRWLVEWLGASFGIAWAPADAPTQVGAFALDAAAVAAALRSQEAALAQLLARPPLTVECRVPEAAAAALGGLRCGSCVRLQFCVTNRQAEATWVRMSVQAGASGAGGGVLLAGVVRDVELYLPGLSGRVHEVSGTFLAPGTFQVSAQVEMVPPPVESKGGPAGGVLVRPSVLLVH